MYTRTSARNRADVRKILTDLKPFESFWYVEGAGDREEHQQSITKVQDDLFYLSSTGYYGSEGFFTGADAVFEELPSLGSYTDFSPDGESETKELIVLSGRWSEQGIEENVSFKETFDFIRSLP